MVGCDGSTSLKAKAEGKDRRPGNRRRRPGP